MEKTKTEKVEALGHDWNNDFTVDNEATCEETGLKSIHCKRCDIKKDETVIPAKGHVAGEKKSKMPQSQRVKMVEAMMK